MTYGDSGPGNLPEANDPRTGGDTAAGAGRGEPRCRVSARVRCSSHRVLW